MRFVLFFLGFCATLLIAFFGWFWIHRANAHLVWELARDADINIEFFMPNFAADFAGDIPPEKAAFLAVSQVPISTDCFTHQVASPAWKTKPTWYMVATADRSINPDQERMMAKRAKAKTIEVNSSHVAYISHPKETAKLIEEAATSAATMRASG